MQEIPVNLRNKKIDPATPDVKADFYDNVKSLSLSLGILFHFLHKFIKALHILMVISFCAFDILWEKLQGFLKCRFAISDGTTDIVYRLGADLLRRVVEVVMNSLGNSPDLVKLLLGLVVVLYSEAVSGMSSPELASMGTHLNSRTTHPCRHKPQVWLRRIEVGYQGLP